MVHGSWFMVHGSWFMVSNCKIVRWCFLEETFFGHADVADFANVLICAICHICPYGPVLGVPLKDPHFSKIYLIRKKHKITTTRLS
jgi:hypothetical protein